MLLTLDTVRALFWSEMELAADQPGNEDAQLLADCKVLLGVDPSRTPDQIMAATARVATAQRDLALDISIH